MICRVLTILTFKLRNVRRNFGGKNVVLNWVCSAEAMPVHIFIQEQNNTNISIKLSFLKYINFLTSRLKDRVPHLKAEKEIFLEEVTLSSPSRLHTPILTHITVQKLKSILLKLLSKLWQVTNNNRECYLDEGMGAMKEMAGLSQASGYPYVGTLVFLSKQGHDIKAFIYI